MILLLYFISGIILMIVQMSILPYINFFEHMYNLLIPILIHAAVFRKLGESLFLVIIWGVLMDNLSGTPAGFYLTFFIWILIAVRYLKLFLHVGNLSLVTLVVLVAVTIESLAIIGLVTVNDSLITSRENLFRFVLTEVMWGIFTAPFILGGFNLIVLKLPLLRKALSSVRQDEIKGR